MRRTLERVIFACIEIHRNVTFEGKVATAGVVLQVFRRNFIDYPVGGVSYRVAVVQAVARAEH